MSDERTFTVCGMADFLAPEIIQGQGHGLASDWYATQFLILFIIPMNLKLQSAGIPDCLMFLGAKLHIFSVSMLQFSSLLPQGYVLPMSL